MFHILLLNKQRAPRNNICSQSELTLPSAPPCQPGPLHAAPGAEGPPPPRWKPGCCGGQWDSVHHTGSGSGCFHAAPRKWINPSNQVKGQALVDNARGSGTQTR